MVPHYCRVTFDRRLLVGETRESVLAPLQAVIDEMRKDDPTLRAKVSFTAGEEQCYTGAVIGSHSGPGTLALFFLGRMDIFGGWWVLLFLGIYNAFGNFAPFFEIGAALVIDGLPAGESLPSGHFSVDRWI